MASKRENFGSQFGAIMALAGSAIGLGNIWRFPYMVGEYGGAAFIIVYILCSLLFSLPIFLSETIVGRHTGQSTTGAMRKLAPGTRWPAIGLLCLIAPIIIISFYSVVGGWSVDFLVRSVAGSMGSESVEQATQLFGKVSSSVWEPIIAHTAFLGLSAIVVLGGVQKGIEKFTKITMPVLVVLMIVLVFYSISLPGAEAGVDYLVKPDFSKLTGKAIAAALGQSFFSMSLGVGTIVAYSSYISKSDNILSSSLWALIADTVFALIAGFAIMPAVFAAGMQPGAGPSLVFGTLPFIFANMHGISPIVSTVVPILFFLALLMAAITSEISMVEACVAYLYDEKKMGRKKAVALVFCITWVLGVLCCLSFGVLEDIKLFGKTLFEFFDHISSNYLMLFGALAICIFVGWKMKKSAVRDEFTNEGSIKSNNRIFGVLYFMIRYVTPIAVVTIFITNLLAL